MSEHVLTVLVVEDNRGDIRLIEEGFRGSSIDSTVTVVNDGETALDYLYRRNEYESASKPDVVLLDLNIPKKSGTDVLEAMEADPELSSLPVLVLSGAGSENHVRETYELGAAGYVMKPVDPVAFIELVESVSESMAASGTPPPGEFADADNAE